MANQEQEQEQEPPKSPKGDSAACLPEVLQTKEFQVAWDEWKAHRKEKKKPLTPTSTKKQLAELAEMGVDRAIAAINHSIKKGWQGIFEPDRQQHTAAADTSSVFRKENFQFTEDDLK
jgi:hypothetical protein